MQRASETHPTAITGIGDRRRQQQGSVPHPKRPDEDVPGGFQVIAAQQHMDLRCMPAKRARDRRGWGTTQHVDPSSRLHHASAAAQRDSGQDCVHKVHHHRNFYENRGYPYSLFGGLSVFFWPQSRDSYFHCAIRLLDIENQIIWHPMAI
ncbi:hypothetical protein SCHPADRAFT_897234 [Schizopora paradoxa]|uniref:Uncharacterized protein n=1 Tax=Schizopora paradoxa TaxID=27342 RepID=A0A0H2R3U1_9AGAM|nr:hypothetical protein SCHPADRAFT_897234 [Schizopora paradoxa]